jgi:uncharacterized repeat protein (TIGR01451 family)
MKALGVLTLLFALLLPGGASAGQPVALSSEIFLERAVADSRGKTRIVLTEPKIVTPGDRLIFFLTYHNRGSGPAANFVVTNPLPGAVAYDGTNDPAAQMSVDGGKTWGSLSSLSVRESDGTTRNARAVDVTHVRWTMRSIIPAGGQGKLSFRGVVR